MLDDMADGVARIIANKIEGVGVSKAIQNTEWQMLPQKNTFFLKNEGKVQKVRIPTQYDNSQIVY